MVRLICWSVFVFLTVCSVVCGLYEEQLGEFDWQQKQIGYIQNTVFTAGRIYVSTSDSILSCLNDTDGSLIWRVFLPKESEVLRLGVFDRNVITLSKQRNFDNITTTLLSGWSSDDGNLQWDLSVSNAKNSLVDVRHDSRNNILTVLSGNTLHFVSLPPAGGNISGKNDSWSWTAEGSAALFLSSLVIPSVVDEAVGAARVAVGCSMVDGDTCGETAVVAVSFAERIVTVEWFKAFPGTSASHLRGHMSRDAAIPFGPSDVLFSASASAVSVLSLRDNVETVLATPVAGTLRAFVLNGAQNRPAVSLCGEDGCEVLVAHGAGDSWTLRKTALGATGTLMSFEPRLHRGSVMSEAAYSVAESWGTDKDESPVLESVRLSTAGAEQTVTVPLGLRLPAKLSPTESAFHYVAVSRDEGDDSVRLLLVLRSGLTAFLEAGPRARLLWTRDEALSRVRQALLLDVDHSDELGAATEDGGLAAIPGVAERYRMQLSELRSFLSGLADIRAVARLNVLQRLPSVATASLQRIFGHNSAIGKSVADAAGSGRTRDVSRMRLFGLDKLAVALCHSGVQSSSQGTLPLAGLTFAEAGFQVRAFRTLRDDSAGDSTADWTAFPAIPMANARSVVTFAKLISTPVTATRGAPAASVTLVVGTSAGDTFLWSFDARTGQPCEVGRRAAATTRAPVSGLMALVSDRISVVAPAARISGHPVVSLVGPSVTVHSAVLSHGHSIIHAEDPASGTVRITHLPGPGSRPDPRTPSHDFVHLVDRTAGTMKVYRLRSSGTGCDSFKEYASIGASATTLSCSVGENVATAVFPPSSETIVAVVYRDSHDVVNSRSSILGDDSVLLKYLNPNLVLIATLSGGPGVALGDYRGDVAEQSEDSTLALTLLDTVTGRVVKRITHEGAALPVHAVLVENAVVATYWNARAKRTELSSTVLYEGVIDKYGMGPLAGTGGKQQAAHPTPYRAANYSAYNAIAPMAVQKTYALPRAVTALSHTLTASGISNKNLLLGLRSGQVFSVDMRQVHPRRPLSDPSQSEKEEGLHKYNPFLFLSPLSAVTLNYALNEGARGPTHVVSAPAGLESSALVLSFGGGPDLQVNRALPSGSFDVLASDFNYVLLVAILVALGLAVLVLRRMHQRKQMGTIWA